MRLRAEWWPVVVAGVAGALLYVVTLWGTYIYDDVYIARIDPRLDDVSRWGEYLTRGYFLNSADSVWRPLTSLSFAVGRKLHGDAAWVPHLVNVLLYGAVCAAVARLAWRVAGERVAWVAGALFAVHPVHVEPVASLVGRADLAVALCCLGAILVFLRGPVTVARAIGIWGLTVVAIFTKELGMLLPAMLVAWVPWKRDAAPATSRGRGKGTQMLVLLLCWTLAGYIVYREQHPAFKFSWDPSFLDTVIQPLAAASGVDRWLLPFSILGRYVQLLVVPWRLSIDYSGWTGSVHEWSDPYFWVGVAAVVGWWVGVVVAVRRRAWAVVGLMVCLVVPYSMVGNFGVLIGTNIGERLIFLPSAFFVILVAMGLARLPTRALAATVIVLCLLAAVRVETYAWRWLDPLRLYRTSAAEQPKSARLRMLAMDVLREQKDYAGAAREADLARAARPGYWRAWWYSAYVAVERGRWDEARALIEHGEKLERTDPGAFAQLRGKVADGERAAATRPAEVMP